MASVIEENWLLDLPSFLPEYEDGMNYGYKNKPGKNLETLLRETSNNHCMYCYSLLKNDRVNIGHLEHSIEKKLKKEYCKKSRIILQPFGVKGENSNQEYRIQYDVYNAEFVPSQKYSYSDEDIDYIEHHINQFKLNDAGFKTKALADFVEDVIEADGKYRENSEYPNYIVDLFKEKIKGMEQEKVLRLCEQIHIKNITLFRS